MLSPRGAPALSGPCFIPLPSQASRPVDGLPARRALSFGPAIPLGLARSGRFEGNVDIAAVTVVVLEDEIRRIRPGAHIRVGPIRRYPRIRTPGNLSG